MSRHPRWKAAKRVSCLRVRVRGPCAGIVLAKLGAEVTATDLGPNLGLLSENFAANGAAQQPPLCVEHVLPASMQKMESMLAIFRLSERAPLGCAGVTASILEHRWGTGVCSLSPPFDVVIACGAVRKGLATPVLTVLEMEIVRGLQR